MNSLVEELEKHFYQTDQLSTLNEIVTLRRRALNSLPVYHPERATALYNLSIAFRDRFEHTGQFSDLYEAIPLFQDAMALLPICDANHCHGLSDIAMDLYKRFENTQGCPDLAEAVTLNRTSPVLRHPYHTGRSMSLGSFFLTFITLGLCRLPGHEIENLNGAVAFLRKAIVMVSNFNVDHHSQLLDLLAEILRIRFDHMGQLRDLEDAISLHRDAVVLRPVSHFDRPRSLGRLGATLIERFEQTGQIMDLDEAILLHRRVLFLTPEHHPGRSHASNTLSLTLRTRFELTAQLGDLDEAVSLLRHALDTSDTICSSTLNNLASVLSARFTEMGQLSDLDEAISRYREALDPQHVYNCDRPASLSNLALALGARFKLTYQRADLEEEVARLRECLALVHETHTLRSGVLNNISIALLTQFKETRRLSDLDEAIELNREALALLPANHTRRSSCLNNLALKIHKRFEHTHQLADLEEGISRLRESLALLPAAHHNRADGLRNLAVVLGTQSKEIGQLPVLDEAIALCQQAIQILPPDSAKICAHYITLGNLFTERIVRVATPPYRSEKQLITTQLDDAARAAHAMLTAAQCGTAPISMRFAAARLWAEISDLADAADPESYEKVLGFLPRMGLLGMDLGSRHRALTSKTDGLARDAAACAIRFRRFGKAVEFLEAGRAIFWSQALHLRTRLDELYSVNPELAQRLKNISCALEQGTFRDVSRNPSDSREKIRSREQEDIRYRQLDDEWQAIVQKIRKLDGFQEFLHPKRYATLSEAASHGPIVILIATTTSSRCDALIVRWGEDPTHIPLPQFTCEAANNLAETTRRLLGSSAPSARGESDRHMRPFYRGEGDTNSAFRAVLATLWRSVVKPIFQALDLLKSDSPPRLWWLPTGVFASLPVHAAGIYDVPGSECVSDYVVSSYTPTLSALLTPPPTVADPFKMLAVIQPATMGQASLPCTREELQKIKERVPNEFLVTFGTPKAPAKVEDIILELPTASIVHFACHGVQNVKNPLESSLLLEDRLEISEVMKLDMPKASLVFLSACQTAMGHDELPDESMHLAATLLFSGFRGAVATMWSIQDRDGPKIADSFYRHLFSTLFTTENIPRTPLDTTRAAHALHAAVAELRDTLHAEQSPSQLLRWAPFIHFGL